MHQIFTQMFLIASIERSHIESTTELFLKKLFFQWSLHFSSFEHPNKIPPKIGYAISTAQHNPSTPRNKSRRHMKPIANK